jgi:hypothetical protein
MRAKALADAGEGMMSGGPTLARAIGPMAASAGVGHLPPVVRAFALVRRAQQAGAGESDMARGCFLHRGKRPPRPWACHDKIGLPHAWAAPLDVIWRIPKSPGVCGPYGPTNDLWRNQRPLDELAGRCHVNVIYIDMAVAA